MALKKSQLYSSLWQSCDELRGGMDASQYKDYVLTLLFMKYVSDKYAGKPNALIEVPKVARLERALRAHLHQLKQSLADAERDTADLHLLMAGHLRALLCDAQVPILLAYAEHKGVALPIWGPHPAGCKGIDGVMAMSWNALVASTQPVWGGFGMPVRDYLDTAIGAAPFMSRDGETEHTG